MSTPSQNPLLRWPIFLSLVVAIVAVSGISLMARFRVEAANRSVGLVIEGEALANLIATSQRTPDEVVENLKVNGLTAVALNDQLVSSRVLRGDLRQTGDVFTGDDEILDRIGQSLAAYAPKSKWVSIAPGQYRVEGIDPDAVLALFIGIDPGLADLARKHGLEIVARLAQPPATSTEWINLTFKRAAAAGVRYYLPLGDQALGMRELFASSEAAMRDAGMLYVSAEFSKISGDSQMSERMKDQLIRLHAIQSAEVDKMSIPTYVERFVKAGRERGIRLLLMRPPTAAAQAPDKAMADILNTVSLELKKEGLTVGSARPWTEPTTLPGWVSKVLSGLIALAGMWLALRDHGSRILRATFGACALGGLAGLLGKTPLAAVSAAVLFPVVAYCVMEEVLPKKPLIAYIVMSIVSLVGGMCVSGLLNSLAYTTRIEQFPMVKLAHFGPIVLVTIYLAARRLSLKEIWQAPLLVSGLALGLLSILAVAFMLMRTGNDNPAGVSSFELQFRSLLDRVLYTRPRTKEFLIGNPALMLGLLLDKKSIGPQGLRLGLLALGAIGQTSIVNTLCHLHSPLDLAFARIAIGLVLGGILGAVAYAIIETVTRKQRA